MNQLAIETSARIPSVCLLSQGRVLGQATIEVGQRASAQLIPTIEALLQDAAWVPGDLRAISISVGPGSFTGLRLGIATAKTLAYALGCPVIPISTHVVLAYQAAAHLHATRSGRGETESAAADLAAEQGIYIATVIDAQRGQWFAQLHQWHIGKPIQSVGESTIEDPQQWIDRWQEATVLCGPGLTRQSHQLDLPPQTCLAPPAAWQPQASSVGMLVAENPHRFPPADPFQLVPVYGRRSAAEENLPAAPAAGN